MGRPKGLKDSVERIRADRSLMTLAEIGQALGMHEHAVALTLRRAVAKLRRNPELWVHVLGLAQMRQNLRGEHRVVKSYSQGIEL